MVARYAVDIIDAAIGAENDLFAQPQTRLAVSKVRKRNRQAAHFRDLVEHRINRTGDLEARVQLMRLVEDGQGIILIPKPLSSEITLVIDRKFIGPLQRKINFPGELNLHRGGKHLIEQDLRMKGECIRRPEDSAGF